MTTICAAADAVKTSVAIERLAADAVALNKRCVLILYKCVSMPTQKQIQLRSLAAVFLRAGNLTFGGGDCHYGTIAARVGAQKRMAHRYQYGLAQSLAKEPGHRDPRVLCRDRVDDATFGGLACGRARCVGAFRCNRRFLTMAFTSMSGSPRALAVLGAVLAASIGLMWAAAWLLVSPNSTK
jgi:hypothetical protein